jgi:drug/metabolite transporter (DMT)-like permease
VRSTPLISPIDALLLLMTLIWGTNYSIIKAAFAEVDPQAFNAVRMIIASAVFLAIIVGMQYWPARDADAPPVDGADSIASIFHTPAPITRRDLVGIALLGIVGHFCYQFLFIGGLARTSVANSALMLAATPIVIMIASAALGHDRVSALHWLGAAVSMVGMYLVVGQAPALRSEEFMGDLMMFGAVCCWAAYTIGARQLMVRHSPVGVTGLSMVVGTAIYVPVLSQNIGRVQWSSVSTQTIVVLVYSALFALCVAYTIWYAAVRQIGSARTAVYSNVVPLVAMLTAIVFLGEPLNARKLAGAAAVLVGVALTRVNRKAIPIPAEE